MDHEREKESLSPIRRASNVHAEPLGADKALRARMKRQRPCILWFTGLSGSGKSTIGRALEARLAAAGYHTYMLDGDNLRHGLNRDLGFTAPDRAENMRRTGEVAKLFADAGLIVVCALIVAALLAILVYGAAIMPDVRSDTVSTPGGAAGETGKATEDYWTPERMRKAKPIPMPHPDASKSVPVPPGAANSPADPPETEPPSGAP